jgi:hypothetical protein
MEQTYNFAAMFSRKNESANMYGFLNMFIKLHIKIITCVFAILYRLSLFVLLIYLLVIQILKHSNLNGLRHIKSLIELNFIQNSNIS